MTSTPASIQFFDGISEEISNVSLRRNQSSGVRTVLMTFERLRSIEQFNSYRNKFSNSLRLVDGEGEIKIEPSSVKFIFAGPEGNEFERMDCTFEIEQEDHWERFMRFMHRYAEVNGMSYGEPEAKSRAR
jgi:photosystem II Psb28-2 protein